MKIDNSKNRLLDVFFYGLYMDAEILKLKGVEARNPRFGYVENYKVRVGNFATMLRSFGDRVYGVIYSLSHQELYNLYWGSGLTQYGAEALQACTGRDGLNRIPVLCCNLIEPPDSSETNPEYEQKLEILCVKLGIKDKFLYKCS
jgi:hypothetical protein